MIHYDLLVVEFYVVGWNKLTNRDNVDEINNDFACEFHRYI